MKTKNILFVCKHNRFRSKLAEAAFNKINDNKKIKARSGGLFTGTPVASNVIKIGKKYGLSVDTISRPIREEWFRKKNKTDLVVIAADNVPPMLFEGRVKNILVWKIRDCDQNDKEGIERTALEIIKRVENLVKQLEKEKWKQ